MSVEALASVVLASYNHRAFLRSSLESIFEQTYRPVELIVLDDGSTDGTERVLTQWANQARVQRRFSRIVVVDRQENLGAHATLNEGIALAQGATVFLCNSDDTFHPERLERMMPSLADPMALSFSRVRHIDERGKAYLSPSFFRYTSDVDWIRTTLPSHGFGFLHQQWAVSTGNLAFTPDLYAALGGFTDLRYCHDWDFVLRACLLCEPFFVDEVLYDYRVHRNNTFSALGHVAGRETQAVIARFWHAASSAPARNPQAPTPQNWPGVFDVIADRLASRNAVAEARQHLPRYVTRREPERLTHA